MARDTILDRLARNAAEHPTRPALYSRRGDAWVGLDWHSYHARARDFAGALLAEGHAPGDAVAIMAANSPEWVLADVGAMMARGTASGIYPTSTPAQAAYIVRHCEARVLVLDDARRWAVIAPELHDLPRVSRVVLIDGAADVRHPLVESFEAFCARGHAHLGAVDRRAAEVCDGDAATLIYTSGTTGPPKGALLSHANLAFEARAAVAMNATTADDCGVSYLPLAHIAEQMLTIHLPITAAHPVWFAEGLDKLREALRAARPTTFLGVPRVWEKFRAALETRLAAQTGPRGALVRWARGVGARAGAHRIAHGPPRGLLALEEQIARRVFFHPLAAQLGLDRLRAAATGAAPIGADVLEFFLSLGITVHEIYGLTETTGGATYNGPNPGETRFGTVGRAVPGVELSLAPDGEVLVRGPSVFLGYFKDPDATREALTDGWFHTGDVGALDAGGFLRITDRKKDLIVTAGGKNVAPQNIEKLLRAIDGVAQAVVVGDRRPYLTALFTLDPERAPALARSRGWPEAPAELAAHPGFRAHVQAGVEGANAQLARYETVKRFALLPADFTQAGDELTPTQKLRRRAIGLKYAAEIEALYATAAGPGPAAPPAD